jgi:hypothetical protein
MLNLKRIALIAMAVVAASATAAPAGTKYATNLVPSDAFVDPPANPTLSPKSSVKLSDKGAVQVGLAGVTDGAGLPVTTSTSFNDTSVLDGSEYIVIIKLSVTAIKGFIPLVEVPVAVDLTAGKGKAKMSVSALLGSLPPGTPRTVEIVGSEVWGPLGAGTPTTDCQAIFSNSLPVGLPLGAVCRGGTQIGISGISIPNP